MTIQAGLPPHGGSGLKCFCYSNLIRQISSPPTRGEWIEISLAVTRLLSSIVSPHTGGVD